MKHLRNKNSTAEANEKEKIKMVDIYNKFDPLLNEVRFNLNSFDF